MDRAQPTDAYQHIAAIAERRAAQQEENNGSQPGEHVARGADDR